MIGGKRNTLNLPPHPVFTSPALDDQRVSLPGFDWRIRLAQKSAYLNVSDVVAGSYVRVANAFDSPAAMSTIRNPASHLPHFTAVKRSQAQLLKISLFSESLPHPNVVRRMHARQHFPPVCIVNQDRLAVRDICRSYSMGAMLVHLYLDG